MVAIYFEISSQKFHIHDTIWLGRLCDDRKAGVSTFSVASTITECQGLSILKGEGDLAIERQTVKAPILRHCSDLLLVSRRRRAREMPRQIDCGGSPVRRGRAAVYLPLCGCSHFDDFECSLHGDRGAETYAVGRCVRPIQCNVLGIADRPLLGSRRI